MSSTTPSWVINDLVNILGFDKETISQMLIPEFESYNQESKLRSHLQDFLGSSQAARTFSSKYLAMRFPSLPSSSAPLPGVPPSEKLWSAGAGAGGSSSKSKSGRSTPATRPEVPVAAPDFSEMFGSSGRVYQKNREADSGSGFTGGSASGSGANTPSHHHHHSHSHGQIPLRPAGAVTVHEAKPRPQPQPQPQPQAQSGSGKGGEKLWEAPRSREVKKLDLVVEDLKKLQAGSGKTRIPDNYEPCFCQATNHVLSTYTPHCPHCGLVLCILHPPHLPCPSCSTTIQSSAQLARLINRVQGEIEAQIASEENGRMEDERRRLDQLAIESGGGAFPTLMPGPGRTHSAPPGSQNSGNRRQVLTIASATSASGKGKGRATATLTTTTSRAASGSGAGRPRTPPPTDILPRPREGPYDSAKALKELDKLQSFRKEMDRPWGQRSKAEHWAYVQRAIVEVMDEDKIGRRRKKKEEAAAAAKGLGVDGRKVVGAV